MAYDEDLADRVREVVAREQGLSEQRMFGGLAFLLHGRMAVAVSGREDGLLLRCAPEDTERLVEAAGVSRFVMNDREMTGWLRVDAAAVATDEAMREWVAHGVRYASALPPK